MSTTLQREGGLTVALSLAVNVLMAGAKLSVGVVASSQALVADGIHSLVDIASDIAAIIGLKFAHLPKDDDHPYGHHRFSTLATMLISSLVLIFCLGLAWQSLSALVSGAEVAQPGLAAAWVAGGALLIKEGFYQYARRQAERLFEAELGISPGRFYRTLRIRHAVDLMRQTGMPVHEAALAAGFSSQPVFSRACRQQFGLSPRDILAGSELSAD